MEQYPNHTGHVGMLQLKNYQFALANKKIHIQERFMEVLLWFIKRSTFTEEPSLKRVHFCNVIGS